MVYLFGSLPECRTDGATTMAMSTLNLGDCQPA